MLAHLGNVKHIGVVNFGRMPGETETCDRAQMKAQKALDRPQASQDMPQIGPQHILSRPPNKTQTGP